MQKMSMVTSNLFAGTAGLESVEAETITTGFFNEFDLNDSELMENLAEIEACDLVDAEIQKEIEKLERRRKENQKRKLQLLAELQLKTPKDDGGWYMHEKHAMAQWCFLDRYTVEDFCKLYFRIMPHDELSPSFYKSYRELVNLIDGHKTTSERGCALFGYLEDGQGRFPIRAFSVICQRERKRVDVPVLAWREEYSLEEINAEYLERISKRGQAIFEKENQPKKEVRRKRLEESDEKMACVYEVLEENNYSFKSKGDLYSLVREKAKSKGLFIEHSTASDWTIRYCKFNGVDLDRDITYCGKTRKPNKKRSLN